MADDQTIKNFMEKILDEVRQTRNSIEELKTSVDELKHELADEKKRTEKLSKTIALQQEKIEKLENRERSRNIVVRGLPEKPNETHKDLEENIITYLNEKIETDLNINDIDLAKRLGRSTNKNRPVLIKFCTTKKVYEVLSNTKKLKGESVSVSKDYTKKVLAERYALRKYLLIARGKGKKAVLRDNQLLIDNTTYRVDETEKIELLLRTESSFRSSNTSIPKRKATSPPSDSDRSPRNPAKLAPIFQR